MKLIKLLLVIISIGVSTFCIASRVHEDKVYPIAIIGAGAGGTMAAKRTALNNREALVFTGDKTEMRHSRGHWVRKVDNIPGLEKYTRTLVQLRQEVFEDIAKGPFADKVTVIEDSVVSISKEDELFKLSDKTGRTYFARHIIMATGIMDEQPHIQGSIRPILPYANKQTVAYCLVCDGHRSYKKKAVVIGYSQEAASSALLLVNRYQPEKMTLLTNGETPTFSSQMADLLKEKEIEVIDEPIKEILNVEKGILAGFEFESGLKIEAEMGFVSLGIRPNNSLALALGATVDARGLVVTDEHGESSVANLFVIGDLRANSSKQIYTAWQQAVDAVQSIDLRIRTQQKS